VAFAKTIRIKRSVCRMNLMVGALWNRSIEVMDNSLSRRTTLKLLAGGAAAGWMGPLGAGQ
jgi:hypothetical protein